MKRNTQVSILGYHMVLSPCSTFTILLKIGFLVAITSALISCQHTELRAEQEVLDKFSSFVKEGNLAAAKELCWDAEIITWHGEPAIYFKSMPPIDDPQKSGDLIYPSLWTKKGMLYQERWTLDKRNEKNNIGVSVSNLNQYYIVMTNRSVAVGYIKVNDMPKISFIFSTKG